MKKKLSLPEAKDLRDRLVNDEGWDRSTANFHAYRRWFIEKVGFGYLTAALGIDKYAQKVYDEKDFERLLDYKEEGHKRTAASYPILIATAIGTLFFDPKVLAAMPFAIYLNWRGECEFVPAEQRIKEITLAKGNSLEEEIDRLEKKLHAKERERKVRYINGALMASFFEPGAAYLIYEGYKLFDKGPVGKAISIPLYIVGGVLALRGIAQFSGIRENLKKEEAEIRMELGDARGNAGHLEAAVSQYGTALRLNPKLRVLNQ